MLVKGVLRTALLKVSMLRASHWDYGIHGQEQRHDQNIPRLTQT